MKVEDRPVGDIDFSEDERLLYKTEFRHQGTKRKAIPTRKVKKLITFLLFIVPIFLLLVNGVLIGDPSRALWYGLIFIGAFAVILNYPE